MKGMRDSNGGLLFCWSKHNTTGMLLTEDQIQAWINTHSQKEKRLEEENYQKTPKILAVLEELYSIEPKLKPKEIHD